MRESFKIDCTLRAHCSRRRRPVHNSGTIIFTDRIRSMGESYVLKGICLFEGGGGWVGAWARVGGGGRLVPGHKGRGVWS